MTSEQFKALADKIRSTDPATRRKGLEALRGVLQLTIAMIDAVLAKEGGAADGTNEKQEHDEEPRVEGSAGASDRAQE